MWVRAAGTGVDIHDAELQPTECAGQFCSAINRDLIARYGVNANLSAEKQLILFAEGELEYASIFQEKAALLWKIYLERCDIEGLQIDFRVGEIRVAGEIQEQTGAESILYIDACGQRGEGGLAGLSVVPCQAVRLDDKEPSAAGIVYTAQLSRFGHLRKAKGATVARHKSSSFFPRMKRLKLMPHSASTECVKLRVVNGISTVAVQPSAVIRAADVQTPSQPGLKAVSSSLPRSSTIRPST